MDSGAPKSGEKMRLCPSCRMEISTLATKCRFCGESVGRPRDESRKMTIDDLGGETIQHYAPSTSVMEAMEAFRSEFEFKSNPPEDAVSPQKKSFFGIGGKKQQQEFKSGGPDLGLPELDERSQALASIAMPTPRRVVAQPTFQQPTWMKKVGVFAAFVAAILILYIGGGQVIAYINRPPEVPDRALRNPAEAMLASDADPVSTLREAMTALRKEDHVENRAIVEKARGRVIDLIQSVQYADPWTEESLSKASQMAAEAFRIDPDETMATLKEEIDSDSFAYRMVLSSVEGDTATFLVQKREGRRDQNSAVTVKVGDLVQDRFKVVAIRAEHVQVEDTLRKNRPLTYTVGANAAITSP